MGWLLGLLSPVIVDSIKRKREIKEVRLGIMTELKELQYRLAGVVFLINKRFGTLDRELLQWVHDITAKYEGVNPSEQIMEATRRLLELTDEQIQALAMQSRDTAGPALSLKRYSLPFVDSKMGYMSAFDVPFQNHVFEIKNYLNAFNEEVDQARHYTALTFNSSLTEENHRSVCQNLESCYRSAARRSKTIVEIVERIKNK